MNTDKIVILGSYVQGALDAAACRGTMTESAAQTLLRTLINIYGKEHFQEQQQAQVQQPQPTGSAITDAVMGSIKDTSKTQEEISKIAEQVKQQLNLDV